MSNWTKLFSDADVGADSEMFPVESIKGGAKVNGRPIETAGTLGSQLRVKAIPTEGLSTGLSSMYVVITSGTPAKVADKVVSLAGGAIQFTLPFVAWGNVFVGQVQGGCLGECFAVIDIPERPEYDGDEWIIQGHWTDSGGNWRSTPAYGLTLHP